MKMHPLDSDCSKEPGDESRGHLSIDQLAELAFTPYPLQSIAVLAPGSKHQMERIVFCRTGRCQISDMLLHTATHIVGDMQYPRRISQAKQLHIAANARIQCRVFSDPVLHKLRKLGVAIIDNLLCLDFQLV